MKKTSCLVILTPWYPDRTHGYGGIFIKRQAELLSHNIHVVVLYVRMKPVLHKHPFHIDIVPRFRIRRDNKVRVTELIIPNIFPRMPALRIAVHYFACLLLLNLLVYPYCRIIGIHAHVFFDTGIVATRLCRGKSPCWITEHSSLFMNDDAVSPKTIRLLRSCFAGSTTLVAVSKRLAENMARILGLNLEAIPIIPNCIDTAFFSIRRRDLPGSSLHLVAVCNLIPVKGIDTLLRAVACLKTEHPGMLLQIVGSGFLRHRLEDLSRQLDIDCNVNFTGALEPDRIRDILWDSHILVLSSISETFGVVIAEALSTGMPVVATRCGGPEELICPQVGLLVPVNDHIELAEAINSVVRSYGTYDPETIRNHCVTRYSNDVIVKKLLELYGSACTAGVSHEIS
jgi:glycosyltransferase involved in cell wall biosynthesis